MSSPGLGPYVPLAELSQEANAALRDIFQNPQTASSASDLVAKILPSKTPTTPPAPPAPPPPPPPPP